MVNDQGLVERAERQAGGRHSVARSLRAATTTATSKIWARVLAALGLGVLSACFLVEPTEVVSADAGDTELFEDADAASDSMDVSDAGSDTETSELTCAAGSHAEGNACVDDVRTCEPADPFAMSGTQLWNAAAGAYDDCVPTGCLSAYHVEGGMCESDVRACFAANSTLATQVWTGAEYGDCVARSCASGYHLEGGACLSDSRACSTANAAAATQTWNGLGYGACIPSTCVPSFHIESDACVSDTRDCGAANAAVASQTWNAALGSYGNCTPSLCYPNFSLVGGNCVPNNLGDPCAANAECVSGFCATGPMGTASDRCAPTGMNYIPSGTFTMGSPSGEVGQDPDETQHMVTISRSFFLGQKEVTQGQWKALSGGINPSAHPDGDAGPVERLDWYSAVAFANARSAAERLASCYTLTGCTDAANGWKDGLHSGCTGATFAGLTCTGYRLPTESEWEYAARGGTTTATYLGDLSGTVTDCTTAQANLDSIAWWCLNSGSRTQAVGGKSANSFGLYDMLGNVYEWTGDWYNDTYPGTVTDPTGPTTGSSRVLRGGSYDGNARDARAARRSAVRPVFRAPFVGFRLSRTAP